MNCSNCGAVLELVESRRYFRCAHCGAFAFPEAEVEGADGIRILGQTDDEPPCPVCKVPLTQALIDNVHPVHFCATCRGALLPRRTFAAVIQKRRAWATDQPVNPLPLDRKALERRLACPRCQRRFDTYAHYGPGNVVIDNCAACDLVWLDFGEIRQIVAAPGRDRGSRQIVNSANEHIPGLEEDEESDPPRLHPLRILLDLLKD